MFARALRTGFMFKEKPKDDLKKLHQMADVFAQILVAQIDASIIKSNKQSKIHEAKIKQEKY